MSFTVAIDGPAASGKGTIGRSIAAQFKFEHLDTGLLYRAIGRQTLLGADAIEAAHALKAEDVAGDDLRGPDIAKAASRVAAIPDVRNALVDFQRAFARRAGGAVLDGRDIGTVICPDADVKLFVTASDEVRAHRRFVELKSKGFDAIEAEVLEDLKARDARDRDRATSPLAAAEDAHVLDTTNLSIDAAVKAAADLVRLKLG